MSLKKSLQILIEVAELAQSKGILSLNGAYLVKGAKDEVESYIDILKKEEEDILKKEKNILKEKEEDIKTQSSNSVLINNIEKT